MRIWTIQSEQVWNALCRRRVLYVDEDADKYAGYIPSAYRWLQSQIASKLAAYRGHLPWWAYCRKPDLRHHRHLRPKGEMEVRLELEISDEFVVQFPCWAWQRVFCEDYLAPTRKEYENWRREVRRIVQCEDTWPLPQPMRLQLEASWRNLFSPELPLVDWDRDSPWSRRDGMEAVFERLRYDDVQHATLFKGSFTCGYTRAARTRSGPRP
ncbi:MAG: DUF3841 domain-containing protein [Gammaproteobacteria bacterium]|nr:DUF3841 domain-containing protein [Planctomycetota bacterium]MBM4222040.1 DUF3841 domain-containing protein [Gammaproteobacteria bacterium]